ncbi:hypothetical protein FGG08_003981 [Glutinoglossum americanum]|uniref:Heterokaryon incompatibility domain-containing protein n=1 Tax=Glutinoglossum americanum TaxID=1670608 RepID=A0A9P8L364_9PEZI|nr:hypothetical protein FGG08_003981 [Glutinoglossum americanum]
MATPVSYVPSERHLPYQDIQSKLRPQPLRPSVWPGQFVTIGSSNSVNTDVDAAVEPSILCSECRPVRSWLQEHATNDGYQNFSQSFDHYETGIALEKSYAEGCHLCTLIWLSAIERVSMIEGGGTLTIAELEEKWKAGFSELRTARNVMVTISTPGEDNHLAIFILETTLELSGKQIKGCFIELSQNPPYAPRSAQPKIANLATLASCSISTSSEATWQLVMGLIEECIHSHDNCKEQGNFKSVLPTRLLNVDDPQRPRVVVTATDSVEGPYLALSYCWGGTSGFKMTTSTFDTLKSGVPLRNLSKTIQDAIQITRKLGFRWLWVDSLCIIQDSTDDWIRESASMVDVYQNCFVTIAALGAPDSDSGLFGQRDPLMNKGCWMLNQKRGAIYAHSSQLLHYYFVARFEQSALHKRGWVMQERLLSPRTLNFGTSFAWECREKLFDEFSTGIQAGTPSMKGEFMTIDPLDVDFYHFWHEMLYQYSKAGLSVGSDRLIALTGVIQAIERRTGWKNIAGLWEPAMVQQLLWQATNPTSRAQPATSAPTWSWVDTDGGIWYGPSVLPNKVTFIGSTEEIRPTSSSSWSTAQPAGISIRISCLVKEIKELIKVKDGGYRATPTNWPETPELRFKPDYWPVLSGFYIFVPLLLREDNTICGLVLVASTTFPGAYERVGMALAFGPTDRVSNSDHSTLKDHTRRELITLV